MQTHADREHSPAPRAEAQGANATRQFADQRPAAASQNRLDGLAAASPQAAQLRAIQAMADTSPGVETAQRLGAGQTVTTQRQAVEEEEPLQGKFAVAQRAVEDEEPVQGKFATVQRQAAEEEEPLQGKFAVAQRAAMEDEEPVQGKFATVQRQDAEEEEPLQGKFAVAQRAAMEDEEPIQGKFATVQRQDAEEEGPLQGKFAVAQRAAMEDEEPIQGKFATVQRATAEEDGLQMKAVGAPEPAPQLQAAAAPRQNDTGLPDNLKAGVESLSGMNMDNVRVHYNSSKPAQLNAYAYAQGTDIHVGPGQEKHLPHEAWHVVQQAQGRVKPTMQMKGGVPVNDDAGLEGEADLMGGKALVSDSECNLKQQTFVNLSSKSLGGTAQRVTPPEQFIRHYEDCTSVLNKIRGIQPVRSDVAKEKNDTNEKTFYSEQKLEEIFENADHWANETRLAAARSYNEFEHVYFNYYSNHGRNLAFGKKKDDENGAADSTWDDTNVTDGVIESKYINGNYSTALNTIKGAQEQLAKRVPDNGTGIASVTLDDEFFRKERGTYKETTNDEHIKNNTTSIYKKISKALNLSEPCTTKTAFYNAITGKKITNNKLIFAVQKFDKNFTNDANIAKMLLITKLEECVIKLAKKEKIHTDDNDIDKSIMQNLINEDWSYRNKTNDNVKMQIDFFRMKQSPATIKVVDLSNNQPKTINYKTSKLENLGTVKYKSGIFSK